MLLQTQAETAEVVQPGEHSKEILEPCQCLDRDYKKEREKLFIQADGDRTRAMVLYSKWGGLD